MNYKIYQAYYKEEQKKFLNEEFYPFDNTNNKRPDLLEYYIFKRGYKRALSEKLSHWGFFSWKWEGKTKIKPQKFIDFIEKNPDQDVYLINWAPHVESVRLNVWIHGDYHVKNMSLIADECLKRMNYNFSPLGELIMTRKTFCFSSQFVASKRFWNDYLIFLNKLKNVIDSNKDLNKLVNTNIEYDSHMNYSYFPFIIENMFSTFLLMNEHKYKILNYPYDFSIYKKYIGENYKQIYKASELKEKITQQNTVENKIKYYNEWVNQLSYVNFPIKIPDFEINEN